MGDHQNRHYANHFEWGMYTQIKYVCIYINIYKYINMGDHQNRHYANRSEWGSCIHKSNMYVYIWTYISI